ncbi:MAG: 16S rRNA (cytosine(967)-C(5))-methyltransferase [Prochloraceae cyanobacterium]
MEDVKSRQNPRQIAFIALRDIYQRGAYTDIALDRALGHADLSSVDRSLTCELVYGIVRRRRSLDSLIDQLGKKKARQQPPFLRIILHLGLYQLRYLTQIPNAAAVHTSVELAKENGCQNLTGVVNGVLRQYGRLAAKDADPLQLPQDLIERLGILHSFPDWMIEIWQEELGLEQTDKLCEWFNQPPAIDLRVNIMRTSIEEVEAALVGTGVNVSRLPYLPQALRITGGTGSIQNLPGYNQGWWTVQDSSAQLVTHLLDPQPGNAVIDACAAPGGKTTHIAEIMGDRGTIWACDRSAKRLAKLKQNARRLQLKSIQVCPADSRSLSKFTNLADRVLIDAPCSGLGTVHRHPDIRWRQTPEKIEELALLQREILERSATWVKPEGRLVYATCTLNFKENEAVIQSFLEDRPNWQIELPLLNSPAAAFADERGLIKVWPHQKQMDGFFMVKLKKGF